MEQVKDTGETPPNLAFHGNEANALVDGRVINSPVNLQLNPNLFQSTVRTFPDVNAPPNDQGQYGIVTSSASTGQLTNDNPIMHLANHELVRFPPHVNDLAAFDVSSMPIFLNLPVNPAVTTATVNSYSSNITTTNNGVLNSAIDASNLLNMALNSNQLVANLQNSGNVFAPPPNTTLVRNIDAIPNTPVVSMDAISNTPAVSMDAIPNTPAVSMDAMQSIPEQVNVGAIQSLLSGVATIDELPIKQNGRLIEARTSVSRAEKTHPSISERLISNASQLVNAAQSPPLLKASEHGTTPWSEKITRVDQDHMSQICHRTEGNLSNSPSPGQMYVPGISNMSHGSCKTRHSTQFQGQSVLDGFDQETFVLFMLGVFVRMNKKRAYCKETKSLASRDSAVSHPSVKDYHVCSQCGVVYKKISMLRRHQVIAHRDVMDRLICSECRQSFRSYFKFMNHPCCHHIPSKSHGSYVNSPDDVEQNISERDSQVRSKLANLPLENGCSNVTESTMNADKSCGSTSCVSEEASVAKNAGSSPEVTTRAIKRGRGRPRKVDRDLLRDRKVAMLTKKAKQRRSRTLTLTRGVGEVKGRERTSRQFSKESLQRTDTCPCCGIEISNYRNLTRHMRESHPEECHQCPYCTMVFMQDNYLKSHITKRHTGVNLFECEQCKKTYPNGAQLNNHIKFVHNRSHMCHICSKIFGGNSALLRHIQNQHTPREERPLACPHDGCSNRFNHEVFLREHIKRRHTSKEDEGPVFCEECGLSLTSMRGLLQHKLMHDPNCFRCAHCPKKLRSQEALDRHLLAKHSKPFVPIPCEVCFRTFTSKDGLRMHQRQFHSDDKPFACKICSKAFAQKSMCVSHEKMHIPVNELPGAVACKLCGKKFRIPSHLKMHMARAHSDERPFSCPICDKTFKTRNHFTTHHKVEHLGIGPTCHVCAKVFATRQKLERHLRSHKI